MHICTHSTATQFGMDILSVTKMLLLIFYNTRDAFAILGGVVSRGSTWNLALYNIICVY